MPAASRMGWRGRCSSSRVQLVSYSSGGTAVSARNSSSRSNRRSHVVRRSRIHCSITENPFGSIRQVRTRPTFSVCTSPLSSRICRCCITAARVMASGWANCDTVTGASLSRSTSARRVGSPSAWKTRWMLTDDPFEGAGPSGNEVETGTIRPGPQPAF